jgi:hypothetical protein
MARLEAAVKAYSALTRIDSMRADVLKKMTSLLLHPFPRVITPTLFFFLTTSVLTRLFD